MCATIVGSYEKRSQMRLLITGGTGVLGRALNPLAEAAGHEDAWRENDRLRAEASRILVDGAIAAEQEADRFARAAGWHPTP